MYRQYNLSRCSCALSLLFQGVAEVKQQKVLARDITMFAQSARAREALSARDAAARARVALDRAFTDAALAEEGKERDRRRFYALQTQMGIEMTRRAKVDALDDMWAQPNEALDAARAAREEEIRAVQEQRLLRQERVLRNQVQVPTIYTLS